MNSEKQSLSSDQDALIRLAMNGSLEAFNELVLLHQDMAYSHAYALLGDPDCAEDAAQESFIKAFENIGNFRGGSFRSWLLTIVTNSAYDLLRRSQRHPTQPLFPTDENDEEIESPAWLADPAGSAEAIVEQQESSQELYKMLDELPEVFRTVITLIDIQELDYTEAARVLNVPIGTIKSRLARARLQMRMKLQDVFERSVDLPSGWIKIVRDELTP